MAPSFPYGMYQVQPCLQGGQDPCEIIRMKDRILKLLKESDTYLSGQTISNLLGVSRTAVWKAIEQLRGEGYHIEAVTNRGYKLTEEEGTDIFNQAELEECRRTRWAGHPVIYKEQTGSSNDDIMALADQGYPEGTLVVTSAQTHGKGRRGRTWISPPEGNIYMSILLRPTLPTLTVPDCTLVMALAVYQAVSELPHTEDIHFGIKWPNDLVVCGRDGLYKKFVGILTEMRMEETSIRDVTIGIGLNVNMPHVPEEVEKSATTLRQALGYTVNRAALVMRCWKYFEEDYSSFTAAASFAPLRSVYEKALVNVGRRVRVLDPKGEYTGLALGVADDGELIVQVDGSREKRLIGSGEISVRGVMGEYV